MSARRCAAVESPADASPHSGGVLYCAGSGRASACASRRRRPRTSASLRHPRAIQGDNYLPWGANSNYGHFLIDCLPAVATARQISELADYDFVFPPLKQWQRRHLHLIGLHKYKELDSPLYSVGDVVFLSCMDHFLHTPNSNLRLVPDIQLLNYRDHRPAGSKVYISRRGNKKDFS